MSVESAPMRTAAYARFSSDLQRDTSLEDQLRNCREYAQRHGWTWQEGHVYTDAAISGSSIEGRAGLEALLTAAATLPRDFDVVLVDDSSRVARDLADALRVLQRLRFAGIRVIYISQGIDSSSEQAETLVAVHGLVDGLYLREMAAKIKRGLRGQLTRGLATGGRTYGYRTVPVPDPNRAGEKIGCRIEIEPTEAETVRLIFQWFANGLTIPQIITRLQQRGAPPPSGPGAIGAWRTGAIRRILANPKYRGIQVWGRRRNERKPGCRAIVARPVAPSEWQTLERPDLRIVDEELWHQVETVRRQRTATFNEHRQGGRNLLCGRPALAGTSTHLFSGFLKCGVCGRSVSVIGRHLIKGKLYRYLGCAYRDKNGASACSNKLTVRVEHAEAPLLAGIQRELLSPDMVAYVTAQLTKALEAVTDQRPAQLEALIRQRDAVRGKVQNLVSVLESGTASAAILRTLQDREAEAMRLDAEIAALSQPVDAHRLAVLPTWVRQQLADVAGLLQDVPDQARNEFERLQLRFTLTPVLDVPAGDKPFLRAIGEGQFHHLTGDAAFPSTGLSLLR